MSNSNNNSGAEVLGKIFLAVIAIVVILSLAALLFQLVVFNLGVVGLAAAFGATVSKISFGTALGGIFVLSALRNVFSGSPVSISKDA